MHERLSTPKYEAATARANRSRHRLIHSQEALPPDSCEASGAIDGLLYHRRRPSDAIGAGAGPAPDGMGGGKYSVKRAPPSTASSIEIRPPWASIVR